MNIKEKYLQKANHKHNIPLHKKWSLADRPVNYHWSSSNFYEANKDDFGFLTNFNEEF